MYGKTIKSESSKIINSIYIVGLKDYDIERNIVLNNIFIIILYPYRFKQKSFFEYIAYKTRAFIFNSKFT